MPNNQISITELPLSENGSTQAGWVDALTIDTKLTGQKLNDASIFINFLTLKESYHTALIPENGIHQDMYYKICITCL